jgi:hypothetical protein
MDWATEIAMKVMAKIERDQGAEEPELRITQSDPDIVLIAEALRDQGSKVRELHAARRHLDYMLWAAKMVLENVGNCPGACVMIPGGADGEDYCVLCELGVATEADDEAVEDHFRHVAEKKAAQGSDGTT